MTDQIKKKWAFGICEIIVDGKMVGEIEPIYTTGDNVRGYSTLDAFRNAGFITDSGCPNMYRTLEEAIAAVAAIMSRNGYEASK